MKKKEMKRKLDVMPFDKTFDVDGNQESCQATGWEVCEGDPDNPADWWEEYEDSNGDIHLGR